MPRRGTISVLHLFGVCDGRGGGGEMDDAVQIKKRILDVLSWSWCSGVVFHAVGVSGGFGSSCASCAFTGLLGIFLHNAALTAM